MTIFDEFRDLAADLAVDFMVPASLVRVVRSYNPATDKSEKHESVVQCRAVLSPRRIVRQDGIVTNQTMVTVTTKPDIGDRLVIGGRDYVIEVVEEIAPDGQPIIWMGVVK